MRTILALFVLALAINSCSTTQIVLNKDTAQSKKLPLYLLKIDRDSTNTQYEVPNIYYLDRDDTKSKGALVVDNDDVKKYGEKAKYGTIALTLRYDVPIATLTQVFNERRIVAKDRELPLFIDSVFYQKPTRNVAFILNTVKSLGVERDTKTHKKYMSIITLSPSKAASNQ